jgi:hypothetical protein
MSDTTPVTQMSFEDRLKEKIKKDHVYGRLEGRILPRPDASNY